MAHAYDRTLLANLGFADKDKKDARHDLAVQYLRKPEVLTAVLDAVGDGDYEWTSKERTQVRIRPEFQITKGEGQYMATVGFADAVLAWLVSGDMVEKRWVDVTREDWPEPDVQPVLNVEWSSDGFVCGDRLLKTPSRVNGQIGTGWRNGWKRLMGTPMSLHRYFYSIVEVKVCPVGVGDVLRQIGLYRTYLDFLRGEEARCALLTCYDVSAGDAEVLREQRIVPIRLGEAFERFCNEPTDNAKVVTI